MNLPNGKAIYLMLAVLSAGISRATYNWGPSGLDGSGLQQCLAIQPNGSGVVISAGDVSGFSRSTDNGIHWYMSNTGIRVTDNPPKGISVIFSNNPSTPNTVYGAITEGFYVSTNAGQSWSLGSATPAFSNSGWPRPTGNLIAVDQTGSTKYLYVGAQNGVMRSTDGGSTWTVMGFASGHNIQSIVLNPTSTSDLFIADQSNHIWHCSAAQTTSGTGTSGWTQLTASPSNPEELFFIGGNSYAVGADSSSGGGIWKSTNSGRTVWTKLGGSAVDTSPNWTSITGYSGGTNDVLYIGATNPVVGSDGNYRAILKSSDGGSTWASITQNANVVNQMGGSGGPPWWMGEQGGNGSYMLGGSNGDVEYLTVDPNNHARVLAGGHGGNWGTTDATAGNTSIIWYPYVQGLMVCVAECVAYDPNIAGRVYAGDEDRTMFWSSDFGATWQMRQPGGNTSFAVAVDPYNSTAYCAAQDTNSGTGAIWSISDPTNYSLSWTNEMLMGISSAPAAQGLAVGRDGGGNVVVLACVQGNGSGSAGIWRKVSGSWTQVSTGPTAHEWTHDDFAWNPGSAVVYLYEPTTGVWLSTNYGVSWSNIYATSSSGSGYVVVDPTNDGTIYFSTATSVYRMTNATGTPTTTALSGPDSPRGVALHDGMLFAADKVSSAHDGRMFQWASPSTSTNSTQISDSVFYPGQGGWPNSVAVDGSGMVYIASAGDSVLTGATDVLFSDNFEDGSTSAWTVDSGTWSIVTDGSKVYEESSSAGGIAHAGSSSWTDVSFQASVKPLTGSNVGLTLRFTDINNRYYTQLIATAGGSVAIKKKVAGIETVLNSVAYPITDGTDYTVRFVAVGGSLQTYLNGQLVVTATDGTFTSGEIGLTTYNSTGEFDNIVVTDEH